MIFTNFRVEPRSDRPSAMQNAMDGYAIGLNAATFVATLASPFHLAMMAYRLNRAFWRMV